MQRILRGLFFLLLLAALVAGGLYWFGDSAQPFSTGVPYFEHSEFHE